MGCSCGLTPLLGPHIPLNRPVRPAAGHQQPWWERVAQDEDREVAARRHNQREKEEAARRAREQADRIAREEADRSAAEDERRRLAEQQRLAEEMERRLQIEIRLRANLGLPQVPHHLGMHQPLGQQEPPVPTNPYQPFQHQPYQNLPAQRHVHFAGSSTNLHGQQQAQGNQSNQSSAMSLETSRAMSDHLAGNYYLNQMNIMQNPLLWATRTNPTPTPAPWNNQPTLPRGNQGANSHPHASEPSIPLTPEILPVQLESDYRTHHAFGEPSQRISTPRHLQQELERILPVHASIDPLTTLLTPSQLERDYHSHHTFGAPSQKIPTPRRVQRELERAFPIHFPYQ